jgi:hypothetical protein
MHLPLYHQYVGHDFAHKKANIDYKMWDTNIPMEAIQHEFAVGQNYEELVVTFATVIAGVVIVPLVTVVIYACKEFFPSMGRDSDDDFTKIDSN